MCGMAHVVMSVKTHAFSAAACNMQPVLVFGEHSLSSVVTAMLDPPPAAL